MFEPLDQEEFIRLQVDGCAYCFASCKVLFENDPVGYMYREFSVFEGDSGWRFFAGNESEDYMSDLENYKVCTLDEVCEYNKEIITFLHASQGASFLRGEDGKFIVFSAKEPAFPQKENRTLWWGDADQAFNEPSHENTKLVNTAVFADKIIEHCVQFIGSQYQIQRILEMDFLIVSPTAEYPFYTLITIGMSNNEMQMPEELKALMLSRAEVLICLPPNCTVDLELYANGRYGFVPPILRQIALEPFISGNWLGYGHTIPNGSPMYPYCKDTKLCGAILDTPRMFSKEFAQLTIKQNQKIHIYAVVPVYQEEMELKAKRGADEVLERIEKKCGYLLQLDRRNTAKKILF